MTGLGQCFTVKRAVLAHRCPKLNVPREWLEALPQRKTLQISTLGRGCNLESDLAGAQTFLKIGGRIAGVLP